MDPQQIKSFIDAMVSSDLAEMSFSQDGWTLRLVRRAAGAAPRSATAAGPHTATPMSALATPSQAPSASLELQAPLFGVVHLQSGPGEAPFVNAGQAVRSGQMLCVIEAMKVFNEVRAEHDAVIDAVLVSSGQEVEAGQAVLRFR